MQKHINMKANILKKKKKKKRITHGFDLIFTYKYEMNNRGRCEEIWNGLEWMQGMLKGYVVSKHINYIKINLIYFTLKNEKITLKLIKAHK